MKIQHELTAWEHGAISLGLQRLEESWLSDPSVKPIAKEHMRHLRKVINGASAVVTDEKQPAAACEMCGGWTGQGGMSQHRDAETPVHGRIGCTCSRSRI